MKVFLIFFISLYNCSFLFGQNDCPVQSIDSIIKFRKNRSDDVPAYRSHACFGKGEFKGMTLLTDNDFVIEISVGNVSFYYDRNELIKTSVSKLVIESDSIRHDTTSFYFQRGQLCFSYPEPNSQEDVVGLQNKAREYLKSYFERDYRK